MAFIAEAGQAIDPASGVIDAIAPARLVQFPMRDGTFALLTADGRTLFGQALDWAAGLIGEASSISLTDVDFLAQVAGPQITLRWTSEPGRTNNILGSADLTGAPATWPVLQANVPSAGTQSTGTVTLAAGTLTMFFVVTQNP